MRKNVLISIIGYIWTNNNLKAKYCFIASIIMLLFARVVSVSVPLIFKIIVDSMHNGNINYTIHMVILYGATRVVSQFFNECKEILFSVVEQKTIKRIAVDLFHHLHSLSLNFYLTKGTAEIVTVIERGIKSIETILKFSGFNIIPTFFEIVFVCVILFSTYRWSYATIILGTLILYVVYTLLITRWRSKSVISGKRVDGDALGKVIDSIINCETVKYFNNESFEEENYLKLVSIYERLSINNKLSLSLLNIGQSFIIAIGMILVCTLAVYDFFVSQTIVVGDLILLNIYLIQLYQPLSNLGFSYREISLAMIDSEKIFKFMDEVPEIRNPHNPKFLSVCKGKVRFNNVSFGYTMDRKILHDISFVVEEGQKVAIVGKSGFGKSTISKLLFRFYDISEGSITLDDEDIYSLDISNLRSMIGVVPQETVLFNDTIYYNIAYGNPYKASMQEVERVAKLASMHDLIMSLPLGYNTVVGDRGLKLSGGEKQRVSIARMLMKNPRIFIFDEATSSLDTKTEQTIQESINSVSKGYSTIIIAHRLSTVKDADNIIVLESGKIVETGTHDELLEKKNGIYHQMWNQQKKNRILQDEHN